MNRVEAAKMIGWDRPYTRRDAIILAGMLVGGGAAITARVLVPSNSDSSDSSSAEIPASSFTPEKLPTVTPEQARYEQFRSYVENSMVIVRGSEYISFAQLAREEGLKLGFSPTDMPLQTGKVVEEIGLKMRYFPLDTARLEYQGSAWPQYGSHVEWTNEVTIIDEKRGRAEKWGALRIPKFGNGWGFFRLSTQETGKPVEQYVGPTDSQ